MRILIVDDDPLSRKVMKQVMGSFGQCQVVDNGNGAVEAFSEALQQGQPFGLVTLDVFMPEKDGLETLLDLREMEKALGQSSQKPAIMFMVTSASEKDSLVTAKQAGCDDYILKPIDQYLFAHKLAKFGILKPQEPARPSDLATQAKPEPRPAALAPQAKGKVDIGLEILRRFKSGEISLPSPPTLYTRFHALVSEGAQLGDLANLLKQDAAISFQLISVSNSPYYRSQGENKTLFQALNRLGLETACKFVNVLATRTVYGFVRQKYEGQAKALWQHALVCAHASELIALSLERSLKQDPFTLGLFHEIGKMIILLIVVEMEKDDKLGGPLDSAELANTLEVYSGQFGAALLKEWGFPPEFSLVARYHLNLGQATALPPELLVVHAARALALTVQGNQAPEELAALLELESVRRLRLDMPLLQKLQEQLLKRVEEIRVSPVW